MAVDDCQHVLFQLHAYLHGNGDEQAKEDADCPFFYRRSTVTLYDDGAYFGFCIVSQVSVWYRTLALKLRKDRSTDRQRVGVQSDIKSSSANVQHITVQIKTRGGTST